MSPAPVTADRVDGPHDDPAGMGRTGDPAFLRALEDVLS